MKKVLMLVLAIIIGVAFVTTVYAAEDKKAPATDKPAAATDKPATDKPVKAKVEKAKKDMKTFKGEFVSKDDAAKTFVVKGETEMTFDAAKAKGLKKVAAGDKVVVKYLEKDGKNVAVAVAKEGAVKEKKEKKAEKKDEKPAAPAAEKAPAAPAKK